MAGKANNSVFSRAYMSLTMTHHVFMLSYLSTHPAIKNVNTASIVHLLALIHHLIAYIQFQTHGHPMSLMLHSGHIMITVISEMTTCDVLLGAVHTLGLGHGTIALMETPF